MVPLLLLSHGVIAVLALLSSGAEPEGRSRFLRGLAISGAVAGALLFFGSPLFGDVWRTVELVPSRARVAGIAITATWILAAVGEASGGRGRWDVVAVTGVGASSLALFGLNRWSVPALIFAAIASGSVFFVVERRGLARGATALGATALGASLMWWVLDSSAWGLPFPARDPQLWLAVAAGLAFAFVPLLILPAPRTALPAAPLALGLSFAILDSIARGAGPVIGLAFTILGLLTVARVILVAGHSHRWVLAWVLSITLGLAAVSSNPYATARAAIAGVVGTSAIVLWPLSRGRAQIERGILVAFVAITAGFNAIAASAAFAFERGTALEDVVAAAPWAAIAAVLPIALAGGVSLGASIGRSSEPEEFEPPAVIGTWALVLLSVAVGVFPFVDTTGRDSTSGVILYAVAVTAGLVAARYARGLGAAAVPAGATSRFATAEAIEKWPRVVEGAARALGLSAGVIALALTFQGLRVGFL